MTPTPKALRQARRIALALHRTLGGWLAALLLMWFATGVVMLFVRYPRLSEAERLAPMPTLAAEQIAVEPGDLPDARRLVLTTVAGRPAYRLQRPARSGAETGETSESAAVYADRGHPVGPTSVALAAGEAALVLGGKPVFEERLASTDQWTVNGLADHLPLLRFGGADGARVYVSEATGQVVQRTTAGERFWAWLGPIPHWIYPAALRRHRGTWRWLVIGLSLLGVVTCMAGLVGGALLVRRSSGRAVSSPYRKRWHRWHHVLGLAFGALAFSWTLSGAFSLNPFNWSPGRQAPLDMHNRAAGGSLNTTGFATRVSDAVRACASELDVREVEFLRVADRPFMRCIEGPLRTRLVAGDAAQSARLEPREFFTESELAQVARAALPGAYVKAAQLVGPDSYEYQPHLGSPRRFPLYRVDFADDANTSLYLDPSSGAIVARHNVTTRWERWLYHGLHNLDFAPLYRHRPLWLAVVLLLLAGGLALSGTGVYLLLRRFARARRRRILARVSRRSLPIVSGG